jgi:hypothetical protein
MIKITYVFHLASRRTQKLYRSRYASKEVSAKVNQRRPGKCPSFVTRMDTKIINDRKSAVLTMTCFVKSLENVVKLKYLGMTVINQLDSRRN